VRERVLDVGEHQLLVLLLVVQPQLDRGQWLRVDVWTLREQGGHVVIDVLTVGENLLQ
jgi:hypothetical protein